MRFVFRRSRGGGSFVQHNWTSDIPVMVRAMLKAGDRLIVAGPPDLIDEEKSFERIMGRDPTVADLLVRQDAAFREGNGVLQIVDSSDGQEVARYDLPALPSGERRAVVVADRDGHARERRPDRAGLGVRQRRIEDA